MNEAAIAAHPWLQALWNMRWPGLYVMGPVVGLVFVAINFGLPVPMWFVASGFFLFALGLFAILVRGEHRQLCHTARRH